MEEISMLRKSVGSLQKKVNNLNKRIGNLQDKLSYKRFKISCYENFISKLKNEKRVTIEELKMEPLSDRQIRILFDKRTK